MTPSPFAYFAFFFASIGGFIVAVRFGIELTRRNVGNYLLVVVIYFAGIYLLGSLFHGAFLHATSDWDSWLQDAVDRSTLFAGFAVGVIIARILDRIARKADKPDE